MDNELLQYLEANGTVEPIQIVFTEYDNVYSAHQLIILNISLLTAVCVFISRYTLHSMGPDSNNFCGKKKENTEVDQDDENAAKPFEWRRVKNTWIYQAVCQLIKLLKQLIRWFSNPFNALALLWFFVAIRCFFDLDLLKALPGNAAVKSTGRQARKTTPYDQNMTMPELSTAIEHQNFTSSR